MVVPADIDDGDPRIGMRGSALECELCAEQLRVVLHEPVQIACGQSQMIDSEKIRHGQPTVVRPDDAAGLTVCWEHGLHWTHESME
ncbi:hypothetical protein Aau02nite_73130 [Amorphoplanes auranticolor]|uniref:Uncharacterized protein n=1 Tax=Actinoplanes auranticolor TaxID=47988 RepID=A0A919VVQ0_9ACTN|nr:hypothetical protein Aau02nite_73130 [Actinoplanes auranticolor]